MVSRGIELLDPRWTAFLKSEGLFDLEHTWSTYSAHLAGTYNLLRSWGASAMACAAGFFHSIYGTERFQTRVLPIRRRPEIAGLIGFESEALAYWNCAVLRDEIDRTSLGPVTQLTDRFQGGLLFLGEEELRNLYRIQLADWLEQVPRDKSWNYRREAYRRMAEALGGQALKTYRETYRF